MSTPTPAQPLTVENLYQKIGVLSVNNEFLSAEVGRLHAWIAMFHQDLHAEITKIETEVEVEEKTVADKVKAAIARVKAKL